MTLLLIVLLILALVVIGLVAFTARTAARVEAGLPPQGRFIDVPGARLHVVEKGEGPALLLIHGLASNLRHFTYGVMDRLAADYRWSQWTGRAVATRYACRALRPRWARRPR